jgi:hypothetical protein
LAAFFIAGADAFFANGLAAGFAAFFEAVFVSLPTFFATGFTAAVSADLLTAFLVTKMRLVNSGAVVAR